MSDRIRAPLTLADWQGGGLRSSLLRTTADRLGDVVAMLDWTFDQQQRRAAGGRAVADAKAAATRDKIIRVAGALDPRFRGWVRTVGLRIERDLRDLKKCGFETCPDVRTIRKVRRYLLEKGATLAPCTPPLQTMFQTTSSTT